MCFSRSQRRRERVCNNTAAGIHGLADGGLRPFTHIKTGRVFTFVQLPNILEFLLAEKHSDSCMDGFSRGEN